MASRKDDKGYVLWKGESKRKDGYYIYQYKDLVGRRRVAYAKDLPTLRKKEKEIIFQCYIRELIVNFSAD